MTSPTKLLSDEELRARREWASPAELVLLDHIDALNEKITDLQEHIAKGAQIMMEMRDSVATRTSLS